MPAGEGGHTPGLHGGQGRAGQACRVRLKRKCSAVPRSRPIRNNECLLLIACRSSAYPGSGVGAAALMVWDTVAAPLSNMIVTWCTRQGRALSRSPVSGSRLRSARAEASAQARSRSACSRRPRYPLAHPPFPSPGDYPVRDRHDETLAGVRQTGRHNAVPGAVVTSTLRRLRWQAWRTSTGLALWRWPSLGTSRDNRAHVPGLRPTVRNRPARR